MPCNCLSCGYCRNCGAHLKNPHHECHLCETCHKNLGPWHAMADQPFGPDTQRIEAEIAARRMEQ